MKSPNGPMQRERGARVGSKAALTLTELIVVIGILGILAALFLPQISLIQPKADEIVCMSHLRNLWIAFAPCATEDSGWPQLPSGTQPGSKQEEEFWILYSSNALGISPKMWHCPTIERVMRQHPPEKGKESLIHYLPTLFDSRPGIATRWPGMPWFSEIANVHGHGNLVIRADGTVMPSSPAP
jgi:prepilin-type N-terminal cleavage/methylation domain-containing protein